MTARAQEVSCPKCGGDMWDNRLNKKNPKSPDFKCKNRACEGVIWPPKKVQMTGELGYGAGSIPERSAPQAHNFGANIPDLDGPALPHGAMVTEKLNELMASYDLCFSHAVTLASKAEKVGTVLTLEGLSAIAATLFIAAKEKGLA